LEGFGIGLVGQQLRVLQESLGHEKARRALPIGEDTPSDRRTILLLPSNRPDNQSITLRARPDTAFAHEPQNHFADYLPFLSFIEGTLYSRKDVGLDVKD
jgi:hypothetical protein